MKRTLIHTFWMAAALPLILASCTQEELPDMYGTSDSNTLSITVTDGGYHTSTDGTGVNPSRPQSRTIEDGYQTKFTAGDACGLYIVRNGKVVFENVKLTAKAGENGALTWQPYNKNLAGGMNDESYFLYYPYQENMAKDNINAADTKDAESFFAQLIANWQPKSDQSNYDDYTASDLMTAKGISNTNGNKLTLSFSMTHCMAMAVVEMPKTVYKFTNEMTNGESIPDYTVATSADFTDNKPYGITTGTYCYLVNPKKAQKPTIKGSYNDGSKTFTISLAGMSASKYKTYNVDGGTNIKTHELQVGDFLLADGSLVSKDQSLSEEQKANVSAIVFWSPAETDYTDQDRKIPARLTDDKIMSAEHPNCTHGLAVAVKTVTYDSQEDMIWQNLCEFVKNWQAADDGFSHDKKDNFVSIASGTEATDNINRIYGYQNTVVLRAYNKYCQDESAFDYIVIPVAALDEFAKESPAPKGSTGWFIPSAKELHILCYKDVDDVNGNFSFINTTKDLVNHSLSLVDGGDALNNSIYWSSTEDENYYDFAFYADFSSYNVNSYEKNFDSCLVRAVCAF